MTTVVIGSVVVPPPPPPLDPGWEQTEVIWNAWDGTSWNLTDPDNGVFLVRGGIRGLGMPPIEHYRDRSPAVHGAFYRGTTYGPREMFWPIHLFHDEGSIEWVKRDSAWWHSLHPEYEGELLITVPGVSTRSIKLRLEGDGEWAPEMDPVFYGWASYGIRLQADQPLWSGVPLPREWTAEAPIDFHGGLNPGDPIIGITSGRSMATSQINNPGDIEAWPVWTINGTTGAGGATITVGGRTISIPVTLNSGEKIVLDTHPTAQTAFKTDALGEVTDVFHLLGEVQFAPILPGAVVDLVLTTGGNGNIGVDLTPLYFRPW